MKALTYTLILLIACALMTNANPPKTVNVTFEYDAAGNRTDRFITVEKIERSDSIFEIFTDLFLKDEVLTGEDMLGYLEENTVVYPNPVENTLFIETVMALTAKTDCYVYDLNGRHVETIESISSSHKLSLDNYPPGTYVLMLSSIEHTLMFKIIKK